MADNSELITKLKELKENIDVQESTLKREKLNLELELNRKSKQMINDILYDLTGSDFYLKK
jgi:hypothetical protein